MNLYDELFGAMTATELRDHLEIEHSFDMPLPRDLASLEYIHGVEHQAPCNHTHEGISL